MPNSIELTGYKKLKEAVERDCNDRNSCGCFNPEGCNVPRRSKDGKFCSHDYCDKFKWVIGRAKQYGEKLGLNWEDILESWESGRSYWYMNYYQECNQPEINSDKVKVFESVDEMLKNIGEKQFRCPACGGISTNPYKCNTGLEMSKGKICNWNCGGLFRDLGRGLFVSCKDKLAGQTIFMPISWEPVAEGVKGDDAS